MAFILNEVNFKSKMENVSYFPPRWLRECRTLHCLSENDRRMTPDIHRMWPHKFST